MTDLVRADPETLEAYSTTAVQAIGLAEDVVGDYKWRWNAFADATFVPSLTPPAERSGVVRAMLEQLQELDEKVAGLATALRTLDQDGDGALTEADGIDAVYVDLFTQEWAKDPAADPGFLKERTDLLAESGIELLEVVRDGSDGRTPVYRLNLNDLQEYWDLDHDQINELLAAYGITGGDGPLHVVVHGFQTDTDSAVDAGEHTADLYDADGVDGARVLVVDWDSGGGLLDWDKAMTNAARTGTVMGQVFSAIAENDPNGTVNVTAHSLGNRVALQGLTEMHDPIDPVTGDQKPFQVDYVGIQAAVPDDGYETDPDTYGALVDDRIRHLTLTVNNSDDALGWYERIEGREALGDEALDAGEIKDIMSTRVDNGGSTLVIEHDDQQHGPGSEGHLGLDPADNDIVRDVYQRQLDRTS